MKAMRLETLLLVGLLAGVLSAAEAPHALMTEYQECPVGIDVQRPRLSWRLPKCVKSQSAYEIESDGWSSGKVLSSQQLNIEWGGPALLTGQRVTWKVRVWDGDGVVSAWSAPASFVCGVMRPEEWTAEWVAANPATCEDYDFGGAAWIRTRNGVYRKVFVLDEVPSVAELALLASGRYEAQINGFRTTNASGHVHDPRFLRRMNVAQWLHAGMNALEVRVEDEYPAAPTNTALILSLKLPSGRRIVTEESWWGSESLGGLRDVPWGKDVNVCHEVKSPAFRKRFEVLKDVKRATLYITGVGFYEAALNGRRIGSKVLDPSPTDYSDRVLYSTYVLDGEVRNGENVLDVLVGHGWFDNRAVAVWGWNMAPWRDVPRFISQLVLEYADGTRETVASDGSWEMIESPVLYDDIREGEIVAPRCGRTPIGLKGVVVPGPEGCLVAEAHPAAKVVDLVKPTAVHRLADGSHMVEFPVNFAGWIRLSIKGQPEGNVLAVRYDERVGPGFSPARPSVELGEPVKAADGVVLRKIDEHFVNEASHHVIAEDAAFQTDRVVCSGTDEIYEPRFSYKGFQYVWIRGWKGELNAGDVTGCFVHTAFRNSGRFTCSDSVLNRLIEMSDRAYKSNFTDGVPTDCPHREKNGWTGDAQLACELAQYFYENTAAYEKWVRDLVDAQNEDGDLPAIVPTSGWGFKWGNGPGWDAALTVVPWTLYCYRGDRRVLEEAYPAIKKYLSFTEAKSAGGLVCHGLGDWCSLDRKRMPTLEYTSSLYYYQAQLIASKIADVLGFREDAGKFSSRAQVTRDAIVAKHYKGDGVWDDGRQTAQAMALGFGVVPASEVKRTEDALVSAVLRTGGHVDFGIFGAKTVFRALSRAGRSDLALQMIVRPDFPSFGHWVEQGATSLWEHWNGKSSRNHIMFGDFAAWAMQFIGGIRLSPSADWSDMIPSPTAPASKDILLSPIPIDGLDFAEAETETPYGIVFSRWERTSTGIRYRVSIPGGTTARFVVPGMPEKVIGPGEHVFTSTSSL